jgi:hypothetical protein
MKTDGYIHCISEKSTPAAMQAKAYPEPPLHLIKSLKPAIKFYPLLLWIA